MQKNCERKNPNRGRRRKPEKEKRLAFPGGNIPFEAKQRPPGFSFTETMVTLAILVILAGVGSTQWSAYRRTANINKLKADSNTALNKIQSCLQYARLYKPDQSGHGDQRSARIAECNTGEKLGLIPCIGTLGGQNISDSCSTLHPEPVTTDTFCVTLKWRKLNACLRYNAQSHTVTKCSDPEDPGSCATGCDKKKGYKCSTGGQCVCST